MTTRNGRGITSVIIEDVMQILMDHPDNRMFRNDMVDELERRHPQWNVSHPRGKGRLLRMVLKQAINYLKKAGLAHFNGMYVQLRCEP